MTIQTVRPNADYSVVNATRTPAGTPLSNSVDNATPLTTEYVSFSNGWPTGVGEYIAHMNGESIILGSSKRVRAIQVRIDMQNVSDFGRSVYLYVNLRDPGTGPNKETARDALSSAAVGQIVNRRTRWHTVGPNGGQWGQVSLNRLVVKVGASKPGGATQFGRLHGIYMDVDVKDQPTISPVTVAALNTTRPTLTGTFATTEGDALNRIQVKVFTPAQVAASGFSPGTSRAFWDSGEVSASVPTMTIGKDLSQGVGYTAYMRAAYLVNGIPFWSTWQSTAVTLVTEPSTPPVLTVTPETSLGRVLLAYQGLVNLLPDANDADFEGTAGNYTAASGITGVARSTAQARHGVASLQLTYSGAANPFTVNDGNSGVGLIPVKAGQQFQMSGYARANTTGRALRLVMRWLTTALAYNSQTDGSNLTDSSGAWSAFPDVLGTAPVDGYLAVQIQMVATPAAGEIHRFDQIQVIPGTGAAFWSPGGLVGTTTHSIEAWDRSTAMDNLAREELARCDEGIYARNAPDTLADSYSFSGAGGSSKLWVPRATGSILDFGWPFGSFDEDFALPGVGGMVAVVSFWARASTAGTYALGVDAHDAVGGSVGTGQANISLTTTVQRFSYSRTLQAGTVHCHPFLSNGTGATGQSVWVSGLQWELRPAGSGATPNPWVPGQGTEPDWQAVRGANAKITDSSQAFTVADAEIPPGIVRTYRASANATLPGLDENLSSPWVVGATGAAWFAPTGTWLLKDPYQPERNAAVRVTGMGEGIEPSVAVFEPAGADLPVAFTDFVGGEGNGQVTITALGATEWAFLRAMLRSGNILLLDLPEGGHRYLAILRAQWPRAGPLGRIQRQVGVEVREVSAPPDVDDLPGFVQAGLSTEVAPPLTSVAATGQTSSGGTTTLSTGGGSSVTATVEGTV